MRMISKEEPIKKLFLHFEAPRRLFFKYHLVQLSMTEFERESQFAL